MNFSELPSYRSDQTDDTVPDPKAKRDDEWERWVWLIVIVTAIFVVAGMFIISVAAGAGFVM
jgi:hypothetical protein